MESALTETYSGYQLTAVPIRSPGGRWSVAVRIDGESFYANDGIAYILREEAEKESLNLGRNIIKMGRM